MALGGGVAACGAVGWRQSASAVTRLTVLAPLPPDPAPPGVGGFGDVELDQWEEAHDARVSYRTMPWRDLRETLRADLSSGDRLYHVVYTCGWIPELSEYLAPLRELMPEDLRADLPESSLKAVTWDGEVRGVGFTLSLLTLFYNREHLEQAGFEEPPRTWEELKAAAAELTRDGRFGWVQNYGEAAGLGGVTSYWMAFLQQAGGTMYGEDGLPVFHGDEGVAALQMMIDLMPYSDPQSLEHRGINDATTALMAGNASMMMNWPFMWQPAQDPAMSRIVGRLGAAVLPAGPAGTASGDGADAWAIPTATRSRRLAWRLIEFYLSPEIQKQQAIETGWLPIRLSTLADPEVQQAVTIAPVVMEQAQHPYDSFLVPEYDEVTLALGTEIQQALRGQKSPREALTAAAEAVTAIVKARS